MNEHTTPVLFADTGVQLLCFALRGVNQPRTGRDWQPWRTPVGGKVRELRFIQWKILNGRLYLAVDTSCGSPEAGYFADASTQAADCPFQLEALLAAPDQPPILLKDIAFRIRPQGATGEPKQVHLIVDFGNSRTGALLLELHGEVAIQQQMQPFELLNRTHLDTLTPEGRTQERRSDRWFSSRTHWCTTPFLPVPATAVERARVVQQKIWWGWATRPVTEKYEEQLANRLFEELSLVRLGREVEDIFGAGGPSGAALRTGVSSPKRYLWAGDAAWLEGENWHMADPCGRLGPHSSHVARLQGRLLRYLFEDDRDTLVDPNAVLDETNLASADPPFPRHPPRVLMVAALYELLCQAYTHINGLTYREKMARQNFTGYLASLTLTYPSGMIAEERRRYDAQARKAAAIFHRTLGRHQPAAPVVNLSLDEASAVHLAYIWSEVKPLPLQARAWFDLVARTPLAATPGADPQPGTTQPETGRTRPGAGTRQPAAPRVAAGPPRELRIACIDIGGGTTDLMIARYTMPPGTGLDDQMVGEVLHRDGVPLAGDHLLKRLLERIVVPRLTDSLGLQEREVQHLFGPETAENRPLRAARIRWMNLLFVPLALDYLELAATAAPGEVTARPGPAPGSEKSSVGVQTLEGLRAWLADLYGPGTYPVPDQLELDLAYRVEEFRALVQDAFGDLLFDFCGRAVDFKADIVLLAGQPSRLPAVQELVSLYLPLPPSRIIPMHGYFAGGWYPYQAPGGERPGEIIDAKSPVVVGAAVHFLSRFNMLGRFRYQMDDTAVRSQSYTWGVMGDGHAGFVPLFEQNCPDGKKVTRRLFNSAMIGRRYGTDDRAFVAPIYVLKLDTGGRLLAETDVTVVLEKVRDGEEERLDLESVTGKVAGAEAVAGSNVRLELRTLADERFFLDSGGLDSIDVKQLHRQGGTN